MGLARPLSRLHTRGANRRLSVRYDGCRVGRPTRARHGISPVMKAFPVPGRLAGSQSDQV